jgi:ATP-binding cassette, subfamily B, bacterial
MLFDMRLALYRHLQTLSPRFYAKWRLGDLVSRLNNDIGEVQRVSADSILSVLSNVVFLAGSIVMMLWLNWKLFIVSVVLVPFCLYTSIRRENERLQDGSGFTLWIFVNMSLARFCSMGDSLSLRTGRF